MTARAFGSRRAKWVRWLELLSNEVYTVHYYRWIWDRMTAALRENEAIPRTRLINYLASTYATSQAVAVRRLSEQSSRVVSFGRLLEEISQNPEAISKDWWLGLSPNRSTSQMFNDRDWARYDPSGRGYLDRGIPAEDLAALEIVVGGVKDYVDVHLAHRDRRGRADITFRDLSLAIDHLGEVLNKYSGILQDKDRSILVPIPDGDLFAPLRVAWLPERPTPRDWPR